MWKMLSAGSDRVEARIVLALLGMFLLADVGLRFIDQRLSGNLAHVEQIPDLIAAAARRADQSLLILGNSLTNNGVDKHAVERHFRGLSVEKVTPDGTAFWDWQCLLDNQVVKRSDVQVDTIVIGYAWHLLSDQTEVNPSRLGGLYCSLGDLAHPGTIGLRTIGSTTEFLLASAVRSYALRDTLRNRLLSVLIPDYRRFTQAANEDRAGVGSAPRQAFYSYSKFEALVERLRERGTRVIVVAMPVRSEYELDDDLRQLAADGLIELLDMRSVEGIDAGSFLDAMHLNDGGRKVLTDTLIAELSQKLSPAT